MGAPLGEERWKGPGGEVLLGNVFPSGEKYRVYQCSGHICLKDFLVNVIQVFCTINRIVLY